MRRIALFLVVLTLAAACSSADGDAPETEVASSQATEESSAITRDSTATSDSIGDQGASLVPNETIAPEKSPPPEGPAAPDFIMALGDGGSFTLSEQAKPVYMIFWADW
jgi:hypothetical protein